MKFLTDAFLRGINVQEIVYYGFYTVICVTTLIAVFGMCSDDGKAVGSTVTPNGTTGRSFEPVGCFLDKPEPRALPNRVKDFKMPVDWHKMNSSFMAIIHACAENVSQRYGFQYFAVQSYYECWTGPNGGLTYNRHGQIDDCYEFGYYGVGKYWSNFVYRFVKVNGGWSHWSPWQPCTVTCGYGYRIRTRNCTSPPPKWGGQECTGTNVSTSNCGLQRCKSKSEISLRWERGCEYFTYVYFHSTVNGGWSHWSPWQPCSVTCGYGFRIRTRGCTSPPPKWGGQDCTGTNVSISNCGLQRCKNQTVMDEFEPVGCFKDKGNPRALPVLLKSFQKLINWHKPTTSFMAVIRACAAVAQNHGFRYFGVQDYKECWSGKNGDLSYNRHGISYDCQGLAHGVGKAWTNFVYRFKRVNGEWSQWFPWQPCSVTCDTGNRSRVRTCTEPAPKWGGQNCIGINMSINACSERKCADSSKRSHLQSSSKSGLLAPLLGSFIGLVFLGAAVWFGLRFFRNRTNSELTDHWEVHFDDITLSRIIGEGAFGKVYSGDFFKKSDGSRSRRISSRWGKKDTKDQKKPLRVAVKMLRNGATEEQKQDFLGEIELMKQIGYHRNVLNLLACCTLTTPMFLVVEFAKYGDLLNYLRQRREQCATYVNTSTITRQATPKDKGEHCNNVVTDDDELHDDGKLTPADLLTFAWQIAKGMEFLSGKGFVHRDLAARNVLVCEGKLVKVADFGLSRYIYTEKVYHCKKARKLPIKWMSPEAIHDQVFTTESDVWAFGILLWEVGTLGGTPYPTIANQRLFQVLSSGYRLEKPPMCTEETYELMRLCWHEKPAERPSFTFIHEQLEQMMLRHCSYLDLSNANQYCHAQCCDTDSDDVENTAF
ncbi:unnamed protein product [Porites lobata]|uniref:Protein kinase domain-containing protein n=1 Tax=Porites lobata TaxID=104759 RepID=A0ABN8Q928_9CNID|nr:unnamed protein product [Porites lobata]